MAKLVVDFKGVESGGSGGNPRVPEGDYRAKVKGVKVGTSKASGNTMLIWEFQITEGKHKGKVFKDYTTLTVESRWKLKNLLEALGIRVPDKKVDLTPVLKRIVGKEFGITVTDEEYEKDGKSKMTSKVSDYLDLETLDESVDDDDDEDEEDDDDEEDEAPDDDDDDDDEEEEEKPKAKKKKGKKKKKKSDDDDEIEDLDLEGL